jgi:acyl carrier protein
MRIIAEFRKTVSRSLTHEDLRDRILPRVDRGELSPDTPLSSIADSLDLVELLMELEEMRIEPDVPINTVGDFLWLVKMIEFRKSRTAPRD